MKIISSAPNLSIVEEICITQGIVEHASALFEITALGHDLRPLDKLAHVTGTVTGQGGALRSSTTLTEKQKTSVLNGLRDLCGIFWGTDANRCEEIFHGLCLGPSDELAFLLEGKAADALAEIKAFVATFSDAAALRSCLEEEYVRPFISSRSGIKAPLFHSCYAAGDGLLMGEPARMMKELLAAQGLDLAATVHDPPDHLSIELEYLYYLLESGWRENDRGLIAAAAGFASDTMLPWLHLFHRRLSEGATVPFFPCAAALLIFLLQRIAEQA